MEHNFLYSLDPAVLRESLAVCCIACAAMMEDLFLGLIFYIPVQGYSGVLRVIRDTIYMVAAPASVISDISYS